MTVRYPHLRVLVRSRHPLVWVSGVRQALRRAGADKEEIHRFSAAALGADEEEEIRQVCTAWAKIDLGEGNGGSAGPPA